MDFISQLCSVTCHMDTLRHGITMTHPTLSPAREAGTLFTYSGGMEG